MAITFGLTVLNKQRRSWMRQWCSRQAVSLTNDEQPQAERPTRASPKTSGVA
ncbi:hypothetical protein [Nocardia asiatica]|uniref:hypothetical protein n=1 Tax=Nocardia asiatica TaxID=209252 RepID=UPI003EE2A803